jgi:hypothetical protein
VSSVLNELLADVQASIGYFENLIPGMNPFEEFAKEFKQITDEGREALRKLRANAEKAYGSLTPEQKQKIKERWLEQEGPEAIEIDKERRAVRQEIREHSRTASEVHYSNDPLRLAHYKVKM